MVHRWQRIFVLIAAWHLQMCRSQGTDSSSGSEAVGAGDLPRLKPNEELKFQHISVGEEKLFRLSELSPLGSYEIKISYPASMAASLGVKLISREDNGVKAIRRLLDTEKVMFDAPNVEAMEEFLNDRYVKVHIEQEYISWDPAPKPPILFNIKLAPVFHGIPLEVLPHGFCIVLLVALVVFITFRRHPIWPASLLLQLKEPEAQKTS